MKKTFQKTWTAALVGVLVPEQSPSAEPAPPLVVSHPSTVAPQVAPRSANSQNARHLTAATKGEHHETASIPLATQSAAE